MESGILRGKDVRPTFSILKHSRTYIVAAAVFVSSAASVLGQTKSPADAASAAERGPALASKGHCKEALPLLKKAGTQTAN